METVELYSLPISENDYNIPLLKHQLKDLMWDNVGIIRSEEKLLKAENVVNSMKKEFERNRKCLNREEYEYRNMLTVAELIIKSALSRKESRGAHSRSDYKQTFDVAVHTEILKTQNEDLVLC